MEPRTERGGCIYGWCRVCGKRRVAGGYVRRKGWFSYIDMNHIDLWNNECQNCNLYHGLDKMRAFNATYLDEYQQWEDDGGAIYPARSYLDTQLEAMGASPQAVPTGFRPWASGLGYDDEGPS